MSPAISTRGHGVPRHGHVDDVVVLEVDFGRASGAFQNHGVKFIGQRVIALPDRLKGLGFEGDVLADRHVPHNLSANDHLGADVRMGLEQHRVHAHIRVKPAGLGLDRLSAADFSSVFCDAGVQGHVLGLERGRTQSVLKQDAAQGGRENAFARIGSGSLKHQGRSLFFRSRHA
jgi:hypothetical protein